MKCLNCNMFFEKKRITQKFCTDLCRNLNVKKNRRIKLENLDCLKGEYWSVLLENEYFISNFGRIYSAPYKKIMKTSIDKYGYEKISLKKLPKKDNTVHRLVANHFIENPERKPQVNHKDGNKLNNHVDNLEWVTAHENVRHSIEKGLKRTCKGKKRSYKVEQPLRRKPVDQFDLNGNLLNTFESQIEASEKLNINAVYISRCCTGVSKTTNGFIFKYKKNN